MGPVAHGGFCVAREQGRAVFVRHALPGERVRAVVTEDRGGSYCRADAVQVLEPAAGRVPAPCPVAGPGGCGGCDFQHADHGTQRGLKAAVVAEQLRRIAGLDIDVTVEALPGGPLGWRTRTRLTADGSGRGGFRVHRSHDVVPVDGCPITVAGALDGVLARRWTPGTEIEVVVDGEGHTHVAELHPGRAQERVHGSGTAVQHAAGRRWDVSARGFWQVHPAAAGALAGIVGEWAAAPPGGCAWDLYGGVGLFGSVLAGQVGTAGSVVVIESSKRAVADGAAALADLPQLRFVTGRVERVLPWLQDTPDVVVLDPPRRGAGKQVAAAVAAASPARIVHVACDPAALARDVAALVTAGYRMAALRALDTFPMTHHVECVALLQRTHDPAR
ncbi:MAG: class I SAM-dependent RNA methyltransferase [Pseudonocardiaceae bacterium]|nr:class I SAM-dependent RNA methyltransferase [Pseudonocardiaceae bacterium]